jgi:hypothetical protein
MKTEIQKTESAPMQVAQAVTPMDLIASAQASGADIDKMQQLFELKLRVDADQALREYNRAVAKFKTENTVIYKNSRVDFQTAKGRTSYKHATLDNVVNTVTPLLAKYGLNHSWTTKQDKGVIFVKCKLAHADGHSESTSLHGPPDTSGTKNNVQAIASTVTYLERYTLMMILGLASGDPDNDGRVANSAPVKTIDDHQYAELASLIDEVNADFDGFLSYLKVDSLKQLPKSQYASAVKALEGKRGK